MVSIRVHVQLTSQKHLTVFNIIFFFIGYLKLVVNMKCIECFSSCLYDRIQCTKYADVLSDPLPIAHGVPKGNVFGSQLFNIYLNDLIQKLPYESIVAYADDITITTHGSTLVEAADNMQNLLNTIYNWSAENYLLINAPKCFTMSVKPQLRSKHTSITPEVYINEQLVKIFDKITINGVRFTKYLLWTSHADHVIQKSSHMFDILRRDASSMNSNGRS